MLYDKLGHISLTLQSWLAQVTPSLSYFTLPLLFLLLLQLADTFPPSRVPIQIKDSSFSSPNLNRLCWEIRFADSLIQIRASNSLSWTRTTESRSFSVWFPQFFYLLLSLSCIAAVEDHLRQRIWRWGVLGMERSWNRRIWSVFREASIWRSMRSWTPPERWSENRAMGLCIWRACRGAIRWFCFGFWGLRALSRWRKSFGRFRCWVSWGTRIWFLCRRSTRGREGRSFSFIPSSLGALFLSSCEVIRAFHLGLNHVWIDWDW